MITDSINNGWVKFHRNILNWEWYSHLPTRVLFFHLILTANHQNQKWQGVEIKRGQKVTSLANLANETGLTIKQIRTAISNLKTTGELASQTTNNYSLISITNYDLYQQEGKPKGKRRADEGQAEGKQRATNKNDKNDKNIIINNNIGIPDFINFDLWNKFLQMRLDIKKPATENAQKLIISKLEKFHSENINVNLAIENSIINQWLDIYKPKGEMKNERYITGNTAGYAKNNNTAAGSGKPTIAELYKQSNERIEAEYTGS